MDQVYTDLYSEQTKEHIIIFYRNALNKFNYISKWNKFGIMEIYHTRLLHNNFFLFMHIILNNLWEVMQY